MIQVDVTSVVIIAQVEIAVLLKERGGKRTLPIFVGVLEANAIAAHLNKEQFSRPLTHDLFRNVLEKLGCKLIRIEVCDLVNSTFIGKLVLEHGGKALEIDSRPSDAISLALRCSAPIFVDERVMDEAGKEIDVIESAVMAASTEATEEKIAPAAGKEREETIEEKLAKALEKAVHEERYEDAARIRDQLNEQKKKTSRN